MHKDCWGYDISEYALSQADDSIKQFVSGDLDLLGDFDLVIAKDVLEHIDYANIESILKRIYTITEDLFCIVPIGRDGKYIVPIYELDKTHIIREDLNWWGNMFQECGFYVEIAKYNMKHMKQNYEKWEEGNGFFLLRKL